MPGTTNHKPKPEPAYQALAAGLRDQILAGAFPPTRRLPTDAELSSSHGVSRQTVRHAFDQLVSEGLVYRVRGRGSFAVGSPPGSSPSLRWFGSIEDLMALATDTEIEIIQPLTETVEVAAANRLGLSSDVVYRGVVRHLHQGAPIGAATVYLPPSLHQVARDRRLRRGRRVSGFTILRLADEAGESPIAGAHQSITATTVEPDMASLIDAPAGTPALLLDRMYYDATGAGVELAINVFDSRRYSYRLELRRSVR